MKLLQFTLSYTSPERPKEPVAINPVHVCQLSRDIDFDGQIKGTALWLASGSPVLVAESYETVLDALQRVEVGRP